MAGQRQTSLKQRRTPCVPTGFSGTRVFLVPVYAFNPVEVIVLLLPRKRCPSDIDSILTWMAIQKTEMGFCHVQVLRKIMGSVSSQDQL